MQPEPIEGQWWLPESRHHHRYGRVEFNDGQWYLEVKGGLHPPNVEADDSVFVEEDHRRSQEVHGELSDGTYVTLHNCWPPMVWPFEPPQQTWPFQAFTSGPHITITELHLREVRVELPALARWANVSRPTWERSSDAVSASSTTDHLGTAEIDGARISLVGYHRWSDTVDEAHITKHARFEIELEQPLGFGEVLAQYVLPLVTMLTFLSRSYVEIEAIEGAAAGKAWDQLPWRYHVPMQRPSRPPKQRAPREMTASFPELGLNVQQLIEQWLRLRDLIPKALGLLVLPERTGFMYADDQLMTAVLAADTLHRATHNVLTMSADDHAARVAAIVESAPEQYKVWLRDVLRDKNQKGQARRLREIITAAGKVGTEVTDTDPKFVEHVIASRNRGAHPAEGKSDGMRLSGEGRAIRWMLRRCLLVELGVSPERADALTKSRADFLSDLYMLERAHAPATPEPVEGDPDRTDT